MWVRKIELNQVKCIEQLSIDLGTDAERYKWVTLLGDNGTGKTTILQALGLTLSGWDAIGLVEFGKSLSNNIDKKHRLVQSSIRVDKGEDFEIQAGIDRSDFLLFSYIDNVKHSKLSKDIVGFRLHEQNRIASYINTGQTYQEGDLKSVEDGGDLHFMQERGKYIGSIFIQPNASGWFAAGYGAFRHISKKPTLSTPELVEPNKRNNFLTLFKESEALSGFHQWLITLDYERLKNGLAEKTAQHYKLAIETLNHLLPQGTTFDSVDPKGIWYTVNGHKVSASALSDGYRSIIALIGDLLWRLMHCYPNSDNPLHETGVVLIDELAIHLHPKWQRQIAGDLQRMFPNLQFIVTTHSPLIAAGAGKDAVTYQLELDEQGKTQIEQIEDIYAWNVDRSLQSEAFDLESPFSPYMAAMIEEYYRLLGISKRNQEQEARLQEIRPVIRKALGERANEPSELENKINDYIATYFK